jgi:toxin ParE1/3/4
VSLKQVRRRVLADRDIRAAIEYYRQEAGHPTARRFRDALREAIRLIKANPEIGSRRIADFVGIDGIRAWPVPGFPFLIVYLETDTVILIYRVLHQMRDLPAALRDD